METILLFLTILAGSAALFTAWALIVAARWYVSAPEWQRESAYIRWGTLVPGVLGLAWLVARVFS